MKIPFTLDAWLKDKSQKVETRGGRLVHNIWQIKEPHYTNNRRAEVCALIDGEEDALVFFEGGRYLPTTKDADNQFDLFIITPEPELSEFEKKVYAYCDGKTVGEELIKRIAEELIDLARKELEPEVLERLEIAYKNQDEVVYENGKRDGKAEALRTHAIELTKNLAKSGLDKDSIPYHLIEFMCNLYTCQNWKEIEETAEAYTTRIKAAAMTDLPRWIDDGLPKGSGAIDISGLYGFDYIRRNGKLLRIFDLEKLLGFNE